MLVACSDNDSLDVFPAVSPTAHLPPILWNHTPRWSVGDSPGRRGELVIEIEVGIGMGRGSCCGICVYLHRICAVAGK